MFTNVGNKVLSKLPKQFKFDLPGLMHQSLVTTAPPPCPPPTGNSGDNDFSAITALLKALYCGDLLRVIALLFIRVNSTGVYLRNITSLALTWYCGGTEKNSVDSEELPADWTNANISPLFKKRDVHLAENYRPVSLISVSCKLLEHIICKYLLTHFERNDILTNLNHGFRSGYSCETQLLVT